MGALAGVFISAGVGKARNLRAAARMLEPLGLEGKPAIAVVVTLAALELVTGAGLLSPFLAVATVAATSMLLLFTVVVAYVLVARVPLACACFGEFGRQVSWITLARNLALTGVGFLVTWYIRTAPSEFRVLGTSEARLAVFCLVLALLVTIPTFARVRSNGTQVGLPLQSKAPDFSLPSETGQVYSLSAMLNAGRSVALVFVRGGCGGCEFLETDLDQLAESQRDRLQFLIISEGGSRRTSHFQQHTVLLQQNREVADQYRLVTSPVMVIVGQDGRVTSPALVGVVGILRHFAHGHF